MGVNDKGKVFYLTNAERIARDRERSLEMSTPEELLNMNNINQLLEESDISTLRHQTAQLIQSGEHSYEDMINKPFSYGYIGLLDTEEFIACYLRISKDNAIEFLKDCGLYRKHAKLSTLTLNEKSRLTNEIRKELEEYAKW